MAQYAGTFHRRDLPREIKFLWQIIVFVLDAVTLISTVGLVAITAVDAISTYVHVVRFGPEIEASIIPKMFINNFGAEGIWFWLAGLVSVYFTAELTTLLVIPALGRLAGSETERITNFLRIVFLRPIWFCITLILILLNRSLELNVISAIKILVD